MSDAKDILLKQLEHQWAQARQSEDQRATTTNYLLIISVAIQGFIVERGFDNLSILLALIIIGLGVFGAVLSEKYYERFRLHVTRVGRIMERLEKLVPDANLAELEKAASIKHKKKFPYLSTLRLHVLWRTIHISIAIIGAINLLAIIVNLAMNSLK